ncbi:unnamed protein product [Linum tenue]|uniref:RCC1-like domain-containing protein n=1 Tax=Linum tenue TaxID=586396 RepID=A0AAV0JQ82_9ROSI|nr:unnamed protein product [Linum tenue]
MNGEGREDETAKDKDKLVFMCGYLPGALPERSPISSPVVVRSEGFGWKDVCGGGCGFAMAISDDLGQCYITAGKHGGCHRVVSSFSFVVSEHLTTGSVKSVFASSSTDVGEVYTWGWKECIPSGKVFGDPSASRRSEKDVSERPGPSDLEQVSPRPQAAKSRGGKSVADESAKRRKVSGKQTSEPSSSGNELLSAVPCLVTLNPGVRIVTVAAGGRHTLALSDAGVLLAFGWGLYGQCGQGSTDDELSPTCVSSMLGIRMAAVAAGLWHSICVSDDGDVYAFGGNQFGQLGTGVDQAETIPRLLDAPSLENENAMTVSCGARHSAVVTVDGKVFCWGWNKYGQLGLGDVIDRNIPSQLTIDGYTLRSVACGWWHTLLLAEPRLP